MGKYESFTVKGFGTLQNKLSEVAEARGWDIASLAREAKVNYITVGNIWHKEAKGIHLPTLLKIAATLGVQLDYFPSCPKDSTTELARKTKSPTVQ